jgi:hypothetical protein
MAEPVRCPDCDIAVRPSTGECPMCGRVARPRAAGPDEPRLEPQRRRKRDDGEDARHVRRKWDKDPLDDLPTQRSKEGPWRAAAGAGAGAFAASFLGALLAVGGGGFSDKGDMLLLPLALFFLLGGVAPVVYGVAHVKNQYIQGKWGNRTTGGGAVAVGFVEVIVGGLVAGVAAYGLVFKYVNWVTT